MFSILFWILFGCFVGWVAKKLHPGEEGLSFWQTVGLGIGGSFIGGFLSMALFGSGFGASGVIMSVLGSILLLAAWDWKDVVLAYFRKKE